ncbi:7-carboxy-7-deazaguanine synthase QueE [Methylomarinovum tepidoasis]|uniref:7-carboxy-7-deazaguanine synthase QueE n=1 Tax=Methylomarinovum tepidoasis TaxID=2840183 RepID=UPI00257401D5|nr:7-carboxy-7-deazaguanine synthase QueE [Methylomarinovum sp. IN45]
MSETLKIKEIFLSIQGEADTVGWPTVFVRLSGCPLRCRWCDTAYAFQGGERLTLDAVVARVREYGVRHVTVTGGEPLAQPACLALLTRLADAGFAVSLETSGALDVSGVDPRVVKVMDLKPPTSGEAARNRWENLAFLQPADQVKFVIADRGDYEWSREQLEAHRLAGRCQVLFSPVAGELAPRQLAEWILEDRLPVRFQLQLHKLLWGDQPGR